MTLEDILTLPVQERIDNAYSFGSRDDHYVFFDSRGRMSEIRTPKGVYPIRPGDVLVKVGSE